MVTTAGIEEPITINSPPVEKVCGSKGFGSGRKGAMPTAGEAIASANSAQKPETLPKVTVTPIIEQAITNSIPQNHSKIDLKPPENTHFPASASVSSLPIVPKKLSQAELDSIEDELKRLNINPDCCKGVIRKYWDNVAGAITRVKEALQQGWCTNPVGLFINVSSTAEKRWKTLP